MTDNINHATHISDFYFNSRTVEKRRRPQSLHSKMKKFVKREFFSKYVKQRALLISLKIETYIIKKKKKTIHSKTHCVSCHFLVFAHCHISTVTTY